MSNGIYLGGNFYTTMDCLTMDLSTAESCRGAIHYLKKKREERLARRELSLIPWVLGMLAVYSIFFAMYYGY